MDIPQETLGFERILTEEAVALLSIIMKFRRYVLLKENQSSLRAMPAGHLETGFRKWKQAMQN